MTEPSYEPHLKALLKELLMRHSSIVFCQKPAYWHFRRAPYGIRWLIISSDFDRYSKIDKYVRQFLIAAEDA